MNQQLYRQLYRQVYQQAYKQTYEPIIQKFGISQFREKKIRSNIAWTKRIEHLFPYAQLARWDKPIGSWLLYLPSTWSITMAAYSQTTSYYETCYLLGLFGVGAILMRGAGCTLNDLWDRKIDAHIKRTATRPLACGALNIRQALGFLSIQLLASACILTQLSFKW